MEFTDGTVNEYFPSIPVVVPCVVPSMRTFTPGSGSPVPASLTVPDIFTVCCSVNEAGVITMRLLSNTLNPDFQTIS